MRQAEFEVPRRVAHVALALIVLAGVGLLALLGRAHSPRDEQGRPLLLTPQRRAVRGYLQRAQTWAERLDGVGLQLTALMPSQDEAVVGGDPALPTLPAPAAQPAHLYRRTRQAQAAHETLAALAAEMERTPAPQTLDGLHQSLALPALQAHQMWAEGVLAHVGAPDAVEEQQLESLCGEAKARLAALKEALAGAR